MDIVKKCELPIGFFDRLVNIADRSDEQQCKMAFNLYFAILSIMTQNGNNQIEIANKTIFKRTLVKTTNQLKASISFLTQNGLIDTFPSTTHNSTMYAVNVKMMSATGGH